MDPTAQIPQAVHPVKQPRHSTRVPSSVPLTKQSVTDRSVAERTVIRWLLFGVLVTVLPIVIGVLAAMSIKKFGLNLSALLAHGELLIVSVAISSAAAGEMAFSGGLRNSATQFGMLGGVLLLALVAMGWYAVIVVLGTLGQDVNGLFISIGSFAVFSMAVVCGFVGVLSAGRAS